MRQFVVWLHTLSLSAAATPAPARARHRAVTMLEYVLLAAVVIGLVVAIDFVMDRAITNLGERILRAVGV